VKAIDLCF
jgi:DnaJ family protein C protein 2